MVDVKAGEIPASAWGNFRRPAYAYTVSCPVMQYRPKWLLKQLRDQTGEEYEKCETANFGTEEKD